MIQRYREEMIKANERKILPDTEESARVPAASPTPAEPSPEPFLYRQPAEDSPPEPPLYTQAPFDPGTGNTAAETADNSDTMNTNAGNYDYPAETADTASVPYATDFFPDGNYSPDPTVYWTPPCMQENLNFPAEFPVPSYPVYEPSPAEAKQIGMPYAAPGAWPTAFDSSAVPAEPAAENYANIQIPVDTPAIDEEPPGISIFQPVTMPDELETGSAEAEAAAPEPIMEAVAEEQDEPVFSPSQLWPQNIPQEKEEEQDSSADMVAAPIKIEHAPDFEAQETAAPTPSLLRPNIPLEQIVEESAPAAAARPEVEQAAAQSAAVQPMAQEMGNALLQLHVTTGRQGAPVHNARVVLFKPDGDREILLKILTTDKGGNTPAVPLPAVQAKYSLNSGSAKPTLYIVETTAPGYYRTRHIHMPMYGGVAAVLEVEMTPLPEGEDGDREMVYDQNPAEEKK